MCVCVCVCVVNLMPWFDDDNLQKYPDDVLSET